MATPEIIESYLIEGGVSGAAQGVDITNTPLVGDVIVVFMFHDDLTSPGNPFEMILNGVTTPCTADAYPVTSRDRVASVFAHVVTGAGVDLAYKIQSQSFPRVTHHAMFHLRGANGFEGAFAEYGPGAQWSDDATLHTDGVIPAITTTGPKRRILHGCLVTNGDNVTAQPAIDLESWANTGMSEFAGPLHHIEQPETGSNQVVTAVGVTSGRRLSAGSSGDVTVTSTYAGHWVYVGVAVIPSHPGGWSVGMLRF